ncbi:M23 family metallopeptidase [Paenibacillus eucommiae]|uniref:Murein DD-endopeptidase MepM/ murein hydrolase activator NlpD n=1 Tax=Paenibacillus eucommiae TaxID=1355755 RepID=A0ABS4J0B1_9BACL|nr:M23 family metallopeptidase [Paenibacillus eucommiae]MBP1993240.1 murein DD-endopeptidase MepM/ murein hydrolase activator NlpD [Paenibacillus eucommiae]
MEIFPGYRITSPYGMRLDPITGVPSFHTGIDMVKFHRAPIFAFAAGEVVHAREGVTGSGFGGFGNVVAVKDERGALQCYAHLDSISVKVGQKIAEGLEIGKQGMTGRVTGSHLHYEVRKTSSPSYGFGTHTDPYQYLLELGEEEYKVTAEDAKKIIPFLSAAYEATNSKEARAEFNRLANEVRKVAGLPPE